MSSRFEAAWELVKNDRASAEGKEYAAGGLVRDGAVKTYDAISNIVPSALGFISKNEFEAAPRTNAVSGTIEAVRSTLKARWFAKGNPLNIIPKAVTAITEGTDGVMQDILHIGGGDRGYIITTAA